MKYMELLAHRINQYISDNEISVREFARRSGLALSHVDSLRKNTSKGITLSTLMTLADTMGLSLLEILTQCGLVALDGHLEEKDAKLLNRIKQSHISEECIIELLNLFDREIDTKKDGYPEGQPS